MLQWSRNGGPFKSHKSCFLSIHGPSGMQPVSISQQSEALWVEIVKKQWLHQYWKHHNEGSLTNFLIIVLFKCWPWGVKGTTCKMNVSKHRKTLSFQLGYVEKVLKELTLSEPQVQLMGWFTVINNNKWRILSPQLPAPMTFPSSTH